MSDDPKEPIPAIFATIHHHSAERPDGYTPEEVSWLNVIANKHIPELYQELLDEHRRSFPAAPPRARGKMLDRSSIASDAWDQLMAALNRFERADDGPAYDWPIPHFEELPRGATPQDRAVSLRRGLAAKFQTATPERKRTIGAFYVQRFGGINSDARQAKRGPGSGPTDRIEFFCSAEPAEIMPTFARVSSWSKILSIRDPDRFLIYDSRVAKSLNWLQLRYLGGLQAYFPMPPRRATTDVNGVARSRGNDVRVRHARVSAMQRVSRSSTYETYLNLMCAVQPDPVARERLEMKLFAQADYDGWATLR